MNTCSLSDTPHISGSDSSSSTFDLEECDDSDVDRLDSCGILTFCNMYENRDDCNLRDEMYTKDGPCIWVIEEGGENGKCISESNFSCNNFVSHFQCVYSNDQLKENIYCYWDDSDPNVKCKKNSLENTCFNTAHYVFDLESESCVEKVCLERTVDSSVSFPCGSEDCYQNINSVNGSDCVLTCSGNYHYRNASGICTTNLIEPCTNRKVNTTANLQCGSDDCYKGIGSSYGDSCVDFCSENSKGVVGVCTLCEYIDAINVDSCSGVNLTTCYYKEGLPKCVTNCGLFYTGENNNCILLNCSERQTTGIDGDSEPCGPSCVWDPKSTNTTQCANNCSDSDYEINKNKKCVFKECSGFSPNNNTINPCGEECLKDIVNNVNICVGICLNNAHFHGVDGICTEANCTNRKVNNSITKPCGSSGCYKDINSKDDDSCVLSCSGNYHYSNNSTNGICFTDLLECSSRKVNTSTNPPCGSGECYKDINGENGSNCVLTCSGNYHYVSDSGVCTKNLIDDCTKRKVNASTNFSCGSNDCYKDVNSEDGDFCVSLCKSRYHYTNDSGICSGELVENCMNRKVNASEFFPCGSEDCFRDINSYNGSSCVNTCSGNYHYMNYQGVCSTYFLECAQRKVNNNTSKPCGSSDCYKDINGKDGDSCVISCSGNYHYTNDSTNGICTLIAECTSRKVNTSNTGVGRFECGSENCYKDINAVNGSNCVLTCSGNYHYVSESGMCTLNLVDDCTKRKVNASTNPPCGSDDCYQDVNSEDGDFCVSLCTSRYHYTNNSGKCGNLLDCTSRKVNTSEFLPCGSEDCFRDINNYIKVIVLKHA
jgi:hypothetical protein